MTQIARATATQLLARFATSVGAALVGFIADGAGAVLRTVQAKLREVVTVDDFGAVGDGSTDDTAAILAAIAATPAGAMLRFRGGATYKVSDAIVITAANVWVDGQGATINQTGTLKQGINTTGAGTVVERLTLTNTRAGLDWSAAGYTNAIGIYMGAANIKLRRVVLKTWGSIAVRVQAGSGCSIVDCDIVGIGTAGGLVAGVSNFSTGIEVLACQDANGAGIKVHGNRITQTAQGITTADDLRNVSIMGNEITNIVGQHAVYCDAISNLAIIGNTISNTGLNGIKVQVTSNATADAEGVVIEANTIKASGDVGIVVNYASGTQYVKGLVIDGNTVVDAGSDGINVNRADEFAVTSNSIIRAAGRGIVTASRNGTVKDNRVLSSVKSGMSLGTEAAGYEVDAQGNKVLGCVTADGGSTANNSAVYLHTGSVTFAGNTVKHTAPPGTFNRTVLGFSAVLKVWDNDLNVTGKDLEFSGCTVNATGPRSLGSRSDTGVVTIDPSTEARVHIWTNVATNTTVQFNTVRAVVGDRLRIVKQGIAGAGTLTINTTVNPKTIAAGARAVAEVEFDGTAWVLTNYTAL